MGRIDRIKRSLMRYSIPALICALAVAAILTARPAAADKTFYEAFKSMYVKPDAKDRQTLIFNAAVEKKSCTICHGPTANICGHLKRRSSPPASPRPFAGRRGRPIAESGFTSTAAWTRMRFGGDLNCPNA